MSMTYIKLFVDYIDAIEPLNFEERGRLFTALLEYANTGEVPVLSGNERFLFPMMRAQLDRDEASLKELSETRSEAGKKGGAPRGNSNASKNKQNKQNKQIDQEEADEDNNNQNNQNNQTQANQANTNKTSEDKDKDKDNDEDKDKDYSFCAEVDEPTPAPNVPPLILNDSTEYYIAYDDFLRWCKLYPAVDVTAQLRKMAGWLDANPRKRKTRRGIKAFVNQWLSREQDRGGAVGGMTRNSNISAVDDLFAAYREEDST